MSQLISNVLSGLSFGSVYALLAVGLVLAPIYMLRLFQGVTQGAPMGPVPKSDIYAGQLTVLAPLIALMFAIGLDPGVLTGLMTSLGQTGLYR